MQPNPGAKPARVHGVSWKQEEILDLLAIWGDAQVQEALRASHRNKETFERIANEMVARGHSRTAEECRTKTKILRLEYGRVVAHNNQSGQAPVTCPFYTELHRILRGDASVKPRRIVRSLKFQAPGRLGAMSAQLQEGSEEFFSHDPLVMIKAEDIPETSPGSMVGDSDALREGEDGEDSPGEEPAEQQEGTQSQDVAEVTSDGAKEDTQLPPNSRLSNTRGRKKRVPGLYSVAERMMAHSSQLLERELKARRREHEKELEERRIEREEEIALWREEREDRARMKMEARRERELVHEALQRNLTILESAVEAFETFMTQLRPSNNPSAMENHAATPSPLHTATQRPVGTAEASVNPEATQPSRKRRSVRPRDAYSP